MADASPPRCFALDLLDRELGREVCVGTLRRALRAVNTDTSGSNSTTAVELALGFCCLL
ncbi:hypothetical protein ACSVIA_20410 [Rhodococcus erythropolis]|uniref:hypothetical protein n=1 Tax=Rhodococcus erythropolis TaxID=1833 RepID=UPI004041CABA